MIVKIYIAYDFYDEDKEKIKNFLHEKLRDYERYIIFHESEYLHSTIAFIGEIEMEDAIKVKELLEGIDISDITLKLRGDFRVLSDNSKYYLTLGIENNDILTNVYMRITSILNDVGIEVKNTHYLPHISLGKLTNNSIISCEAITDDSSFELKPKSIAVFRTVDYSKKL